MTQSDLARTIDAAWDARETISTATSGEYREADLIEAYLQKIINTVLILFTTLQLLSQETKQGEKVPKDSFGEEMKGSNRITTGLGHTHLSNGKNADGKKFGCR